MMCLGNWGIVYRSVCLVESLAKTEKTKQPLMMELVLVFRGEDRVVVAVW